MLVLHRAKLLASNQSVLAWGVAPMRVVSRWCRCVVQRLCATDCKHPCLVRAAAPHSAPARMPGVYAQRLCKDAKPTKHTQPFTTGKALHHGEGVWGFGKDAEIERPKALQGRKAHKAFLKGLENFLYFYKNRLFQQAEIFTVKKQNRCNNRTALLFSKMYKIDLIICLFCAFCLNQIDFCGKNLYNEFGNLCNSEDFI